MYPDGFYVVYGFFYQVLTLIKWFVTLSISGINTLRLLSDNKVWFTKKREVLECSLKMILKECSSNGF